MAEFIRDAWYLAAWSDEVPREGWLARRLLDRPWLLLRDSEGVAAMVEDRCPHRFVPLSRGQREGDTIICGYHGLGFDFSGACVRNAFGSPPPGAQIAAPPVIERHGGLWFWPGVRDKADPALIPDFDFIDRAGPVGRSVYVMSVNYELIADNLLDLSHAEFLHTQSFGTNGSLFSHGMQTVETAEDGAVWNKWDIRDAVPPGWAVPMLPEGGRIDQYLHIRWHAPSALALFIGISRAGTEGHEMVIPPMANPHILTPETETSTHYFFTHGPTAEDEAMARRVFLEEDEPMIAAQAAAMRGTDFWEERPLILPSDRAAILARRRLMQLRKAEAG
ncbi:aromatic ring-hydroxylating dioxygenase subunit alpha [Sphingobium sp. DEHP117]|uniref:Rieske 2Fe-2S domain-containing protein n=1 Tax=Sphingobium sp. DEHP117 TaxID=2993436 RepID=UPI0027D6B3C7|nr:Rieske 2Fe-2S domain-containing protein [Sphingobium sp. DEHP117]MDQ4419285.1 aromatic ring-hydroxylating dioxygenase subunit alpha [Sphingobium sp. DEHP117]